jgi:hypothetical protein
MFILKNYVFIYILNSFSSGRICDCKCDICTSDQLHDDRFVSAISEHKRHKITENLFIFKYDNFYLKL